MLLPLKNTRLRREENEDENGLFRSSKKDPSRILRERIILGPPRLRVSFFCYFVLIRRRVTLIASGPTYVRET